MQLRSLSIPPLDRLSKSGEEGRKKITQITRYFAIVLVIVQAIGICVTYRDYVYIGWGTPWVAYIVIVLLLTAGSCFVMWLAERITEYGIGNGSSLIIFAGIIASFGSALIGAFGTVGDNTENLWYILGFIAVVILLFAFILFLDGADRRVWVHYA